MQSVSGITRQTADKLRQIAGRNAFDTLFLGKEIVGQLDRGTLRDVNSGLVQKPHMFLASVSEHSAEALHRIVGRLDAREVSGRCFNILSSADSLAYRASHSIPIALTRESTFLYRFCSITESISRRGSPIQSLADRSELAGAREAKSGQKNCRPPKVTSARRRSVRMGLPRAAPVTPTQDEGDFDCTGGPAQRFTAGCKPPEPVAASEPTRWEQTKLSM